MNIVTSTPVWADIAKQVAKTADPAVAINTESIVEGNAADPHHFEPAAADIAKAHRADIVVAGGGGYDAWLYQPLSDQDLIVHALPLVGHDHDHGDHDHGDHDHGEHDHAHNHSHDHDDAATIDGNEHIWYDAAAIDRVAQEIAERINAARPAAKATAKPVMDKTARLKERIAKLPAGTVAQTEPIADYLLAQSPLTDRTPQGFRKATLGHGEPAAADLAQFLDALKAGDIDLLVYNPQTSTDMTDRIRNAAEDAEIPVVSIGETPPAGKDFLKYYDAVVSNLEEATR